MAYSVCTFVVNKGNFAVNCVRNISYANGIEKKKWKVCIINFIKKHRNLRIFQQKF